VLLSRKQAGGARIHAAAISVLELLASQAAISLENAPSVQRS